MIDRKILPLPLEQGCLRDQLNSLPSSAGISCIAITGGAGHMCALARGGDLWCWGSNSIGQLGIGSTVDQLRPVAVNLGAGSSADAPVHNGPQHIHL
jgi:alpha-tubulin suppressor-like RCC1 family protein